MRTSGAAVRRNEENRPVRRTHINPCFWTAWWNRDYFEARTAHQQRAQTQRYELRRQTVAVLNLMADKVYTSVVERVHFLHDAGLADITPDAFARVLEKAGARDRSPLSTTYTLDIESLWTGLESTGTYATLLEVMAKGRIDTFEEKAWLTCFIMGHQFRTPHGFESLTRHAQAFGLEPFEALACLRAMILKPPPEFLRQAAALLGGLWTVYRTPDHAFPLSDTAFLVRRGSILFACSPRMLVEIHPRNPVPWPGIVHRDDVPSGMLHLYRTRCIEKTFKEIIFHDAHTLETWRASPECRGRVAKLRSGRP